MGSPLIVRHKTPVVKVALPFYRSVPPPLHRLVSHIQTAGIPGYDVYMAHEDSTVIQIARNNLILMPAGKIDYDYLFFIDDDVGFDMMDEMDDSGMPKVVSYMQRILDHGLNICGGVYHQKSKPYLPVVYRQCRDTKTREPLGRMSHVCEMDGSVMEVDGLGGGFLCIKSDVLLKIAEDFERKEKSIQLFNGLDPEYVEKELSKLPGAIREYFRICKPDMTPPFHIEFFYDSVADNWSHRGEDIFFCMKAKSLGFKIYCDTSVRLGHMTSRYITPELFEINFRELIIEDRHKQFIETGVEDPDYGAMQVRLQKEAEKQADKEKNTETSQECAEEVA